MFEEHQQKKNLETRYIASLLRQSLVPMVQAMFYSGGYASVYYIAIVYIPTYLDQFTDLSRSVVLVINGVGLTLQIGLMPLFGWLSDTTLRRKSWLLLTTLSLVLFSFPAFWLLLQPNSAGVWLAQIGLAIAIVPLLAISPAMMVELFPTQTRLTAYSLSFNLGASIMGGTSLLVCTWLINLSGNVYAPAFYLVSCASIGAIALSFMGDRSREPLL